MSLFKEYPDFPFENYYSDINQYVNAQHYWLYRLRQTEGFIESDWGAVIRPVDIDKEQTDGLMFWIRNQSLKKEIIIHTNSFNGCVNQYQKDNAGMSEEEVKEAIETFDYQPSEEMIQGLSWDSAKKEVETFYSDWLVNVEDATFLKNDPIHPEQGYDVAIERLVLTSEINDICESKTIQALKIFLTPGLVADNVNAAFSPEVD